MGRFAMVWSSRLYELYQIFPHSPTFCTMTTWDAPSCRFLPPSHHRLPLPVDAELLVAGIVHNFILGEPLIHAVIRRGSLLLIGLLGFETLNFDVLVEVEVPNIMLDTDSHFTAEGCWLVNGPVLMVQVHGKVMVVQYSASDRLQCFGTSLAVADIDGDWHALLLNFDDIKMIKGIRFLYFGELGAFQADKMLLSLQISSKAEIAPSCSFTLPGHNDGGFIEGLNFVTISTSEMSHKISKCICNSEKVKELEVLQNLLEVCNDLFPSDICLDLISCICFIPRDSDACYALNSESSYHDVVVGDWSGKITKYRMGAVTAEIDLNNASISIKFAVVAEGQGILLCTADETVGGVSALCAETLHLLKAWEAVEDVVIGDFQMVGHDQLLLLSKSLGSEGLGHYLTPEQLTDMKACYFSNIQEFIPPVFSVEAKDSHKAEKIRAIADCLRSRMEAGLIQCRGIVDQIVERADLIKSSCVLLQEIANRNSLSLLPDRDDSHMFSPTRQFLDASVLRHGLCGRNLFLVVMVENIVPSDVLLKDVSLSLSMIGGPVSGSTSVIKSLCRTDGKKHLVASVSLMDLPDLSACHIVHVFVNAKVSSTNVASSSIITTTSMSKNAGEMRCLLKIWVGQIDSQDIQIAGNLSSLAVPLEIREVAQKCTFDITVSSKNLYYEVPQLIQQVLRMMYRVEGQAVNGVHELVSNSALWADATVESNKVTHTVTLRAEDSKHLSTLRYSLLKSIKDKGDLQITAPFSEFLNKTMCFLRALEKEINLRRLLLEDIKEAALDYNLNESQDFKAQASALCDVQMWVDRQFCSLFAEMKLFPFSGQK